VKGARRVAVALLGLVALTYTASPARPQDGPREAVDAAAVHSSLLHEKLREARNPSDVNRCCEAASWLFLYEPEAFLDDLRQEPRRVSLLTGEYIHAGRPGDPPRPVCSTPALEGLGGAMATAWASACLRREGVALATGELMVERVRRMNGSPIGFLARTLRLHWDAGFRRAAFCWLVAHAGLPADYDWRSLTREQEELGPRAANRRTLPEDHPAVVRDRWLETWAFTVESVLTTDDARLALIALIEEDPYVPLTLSLPALQRGDVDHDEHLVVLGERWRCDLEAKTFVGGFGGRRLFYELSGVFERDPSTRGWRARATETRHAHGR
jgi:hypothetical protein